MLIYCLVIIGIILLPSALWYACNAIPYMMSSYYKNTHKLYLRMTRDAGAYGEFLTYKRLKQYEKDGARFLFNCYLPKGDGNTSEIDVLMIHHSGIYVFESKNFSGWIFGSETRSNWTQSLKRGRGSVKVQFYNPIMQNKTHIKILKKYLAEELPVHNIVVFSERCELKRIDVYSTDVSVIRRFDLKIVVDELAQENSGRLNDTKLNDIYEKLYPFTQVSDEVKERHIENIEERYIKTGVTADFSPKNKEMPGSNDTKDSLQGIKKRSDAPLTTEERICPRCGSTLVLRLGEDGFREGELFYRCSDFPKCKYIKDI